MISVENDRRWWSVPGELVATLENAGRAVPVLFEYDDGTLWGFRVGGESAIWDHHAEGLALSPKVLGMEALKQLRDVIREMSRPRPAWQIAAREQALIDQLEPGLGDSHWVSGRRLRHALNITGDECANVSEPLVPRYVERNYGDKGDYYRLTLPGIFRSKHKARAEGVIEATLRVLRKAFETDPDVAGFSSHDVIAAAGLDADANRFVDGVISAAWLLHGGSGGGNGSAWGMNYGVPQDVEDLVRCKSVADFFRLISKGEHRFRAWPTAPMGLASLPKTSPRGSLPDLTEAAKYDVTLSFAGEDRPHAEALAAQLKTSGVRVFYDLYEQATLWGKDLYEHLHSVYSEQATYCVIFVSEHYAKKLWTTLERKSAQERALKERGGEYILPIRIDETRLPGLPDTVGYVSIAEGIDRIAELLVAKLRGGSPEAPD